MVVAFLAFQNFVTGFDGCKDTPVEILHVFLLGVVKYMVWDFLKSLTVRNLQELLEWWESVNINALNIPSMKPAYMIKHYKSLVGKDFKIILQVAPFVFFKLMSQDQRNHWMALCMLSTYVFTTKIDDMPTYLADIRKYIRIFLHHTIHMSARWANKPKFHMLLHLPESIERFGPPSLFATKKFESFNKILRLASIHTNRHSPGRDIAISFVNFQSLRLILSGAQLTNHHSGQTFQPGPNVTQFFLDNEMIQQSMGYNRNMVNTSASYPIQMQSSLPDNEKEAVPPYLIRSYPGYQFKQVHQLRINAKDVCKKGYFVVVRKPFCFQHLFTCH